MDIALKKPAAPVSQRLRSFIYQPGSFFRYQSHSLRGLYYYLSRYLHVRTWLSRCAPLLFDTTPSVYDVADKKGYSIITSTDTSEVVAEVRNLLTKIDINAIKNSAVKPYLLTLLKGEELTSNSVLYKFATNPELVRGVARYLKCFPLLTYIAIWYSPNESVQNDGSQRFHLDHEDYRQLKAFVFIEDVDSNTGPFTAMDASASEKVQKALNYKMTPDEKRVDDNAVYKIVDKSSTVPLLGRSGDFALVDTSRCFHYGSREGTRPRILLTFQYMTPFAFVMPWFWQKRTYLKNLRHSNMTVAEKKLLGVDI